MDTRWVLRLKRDANEEDSRKVYASDDPKEQPSTPYRIGNEPPRIVRRLFGVRHAAWADSINC